MEYKQFYKYGINNIKDGEVVVDGITDGVYSLEEYRNLYFKQLILLSKHKIREIVKDNLFNDVKPDRFITVSEEGDRVIFNFGKTVLQVPNDLKEEFIELKNFQEEQYKELGKYANQI